MKYVWAVFRNLIVLGIAIAIFGKADSDYERIAFSLLVMIYISIDSYMTSHNMAFGIELIALGKEFWRIRKLLQETHISNTTLNPVFSEEEIGRRKKESEKVDQETTRFFNQL